jgi:hypothetical protein
MYKYPEEKTTTGERGSGGSYVVIVMLNINGLYFFRTLYFVRLTSIPSENLYTEVLTILKKVPHNLI